MPEPATTPTAFVRAYEQATNSHDIAQVAPMIAPEAVYWFSDGSHHGRDAVLTAIAQTFATIHDETYQIEDLEWVAISDNHAVCRYRFSWGRHHQPTAGIRRRTRNQRPHQQRRSLADASRAPQRLKLSNSDAPSARPV